MLIGGALIIIMKTQKSQTNVHTVVMLLNIYNNTSDCNTVLRSPLASCDKEHKAKVGLQSHTHNNEPFATYAESAEHPVPPRLHASTQHTSILLPHPAQRESEGDQPSPEEEERGLRESLQTNYFQFIRCILVVRSYPPCSVYQ